jgi:hypothetical protein
MTPLHLAVYSVLAMLVCGVSGLWIATRKSNGPDDSKIIVGMLLLFCTVPSMIVLLISVGWAIVKHWN